MKKLILTLMITLSSGSVLADPLLAAHLLLNTLAVNYLPDYASTTYHGAYIGGTYGFKYELGDSYKTGDDTEGSAEDSPGLLLGYQLLHSTSHKLAITYQRKSANYQGQNDAEGTDVMDSFGLRFNIGLLALKAGWTNHKIESDDDSASDNAHDGGYFTGIGFDVYIGRFSIFMDLTSHHLEDRNEHIAGGDIGMRFSFGNIE